MRIVSNTNQSKIKIFVIRYVFQSAIHSIWREGNRRRYGKTSLSVAFLIKMLDKNMRNRFTIIRRKESGDYEGGIVF